MDPTLHPENKKDTKIAEQKEEQVTKNSVKAGNEAGRKKMKAQREELQTHPGYLTSGNWK